MCHTPSVEHLLGLCEHLDLGVGSPVSWAWQDAKSSSTDRGASPAPTKSSQKKRISPKLRWGPGIWHGMCEGSQAVSGIAVCHAVTPRHRAIFILAWQEFAPY